MKNRQQKVALVTGGGRRLGRQIALACGTAGFKVIVNYFESKSGAERVVKEIRKAGSESEAIYGDIAVKKDVNAMMRQAVEAFGSIDVLINNAAVFLKGTVEQTDEEVWNRTLAVNLKGTFLCCQEAARIMKKQGGGKIINIASLGGIQAWTQHIPYSVSKAGVIHLTKIMAKALAPAITVNAVAPGTIIIPGEEASSSRRVSVDSIPLKKYGQPFDITNLVVFLATTSEYITGQVLVVDGGSSLP